MCSRSHKLAIWDRIALKVHTRTRITLKVHTVTKIVLKVHTKTNQHDIVRTTVNFMKNRETGFRNGWTTHKKWKRWGNKNSEKNKFSDVFNEKYAKGSKNKGNTEKIRKEFGSKCNIKDKGKRKIGRISWGLLRFKGEKGRSMKGKGKGIESDGKN